MKKVLFFLLCMTVLKTGLAQNMGLGIEGGLNMATMTEKASGETITSNYLAGGRAGVMVDLGITNNFYVQPGVFFAMNGTSISNVSESVGGVTVSSSTTQTFSVYSIELPLNLEYKFGEMGGPRFFVGVGPYVAYNLSATAAAGGHSVTEKIGSTAGTDQLAALDYGAGVNLGFQLACGLYFRAQYQMGFANLQPGGGSSTTTTSSIGLSVGYLFGERIRYRTDLY